MQSTPASQQLGSSIRLRRKGLSMTQAQVADLAHVGTPFIHMLEHGKSTVRLDKLLAVLEVLGLGLQLGQADTPLSVRPEQGEGS